MSSSPVSPLSPGYQAFKDVMDVEDLRAWHEQVVSGRLRFDPHDRAYPEGPDALADAISLFVTEEAFEGAKPVLEWLVGLGMSPWTVRTGNGTSPYQDRCLWARHDSPSPLLEWCWSLDIAPAHLESEVLQRIRSDTLDAVLSDATQLGSQRQLRMLGERGFALTERWADGRTTLDRILRLDMAPDEWFEHFKSDNVEVVETVRGYRRLAAALEAESPGHHSVHALFLLAGMRGCHSDRYCNDVRAERAWTAHDWHAPMRGLMSDIARSQGFKGNQAAQHEQVWEASMDWASQQPASLMLAGAVLGACQVHCRNLMALEPSDLKVRLKGWAALMEGGVAVGHLLDGVTEEAMLEGYATFSWFSAFRLAHETITTKNQKQAIPLETFGHPGIWPLALPGEAFFSTFGSENLLALVLAQDNVWPRTPTFMRMAASEKIQESPRLQRAVVALAEQQAQCRLDALEGVFPQPAQANPQHPRARM